MNKTEIKRETKILKKYLQNVYKRLDRLMNDAEISAEKLSEKEMFTKAEELNEMADYLLSAKNTTSEAIKDINHINEL